MIKDRAVLSWAFYDWANSAYATVVMAGFFPVFFKQFWAVDESAINSTFYLGAANSIASLIIVLLAPILGAIADQCSAKKRFLIFFALIGCVMTFSLYFAGQGEWELAVLMYIAATIGFSGSNIFYDSLIISVAKNHNIDKVSALGFALGYLGGGILFAINVLMTQMPELFGLADATQAVKISFIMVAIWWMLFTIPVILFVQEPHNGNTVKPYEAIKKGFLQLFHTFKEIQQLKVVGLFLLAYWLYIDGVDTIIRMAVDYGMALGFDQGSLIIALLITQFVGFPAAILFGILGEKIGTKNGIFIALFVYIFVTIYAYSIENISEFYLLAIAVGLVQGGIQSLSRSFFARIIPSNKSGEFFGFYNMLGKFAAVIGPIMMGWVGLLTNSSRVSILSLLILFILGGILLYMVNEKQGVAMAKELEKV